MNILFKKIKLNKIAHLLIKTINEKDVLKMKKIKYLLLLATILILLVGVASANEVSKDKSDTNSITKEVAKQDTHKLSDTGNINKKRKYRKTSKQIKHPPIT